jgi:antitoxin CcdA
MNKNLVAKPLLPTDFAAAQQNEQLQHQAEADACVADWNALHESIGSFADEHTTL